MYIRYLQHHTARCFSQKEKSSSFSLASFMSYKVKNTVYYSFIKHNRCFHFNVQYHTNPLTYAKTFLYMFNVVDTTYLHITFSYERELIVCSYLQISLREKEVAYNQPLRRYGVFTLWGSFTQQQNVNVFFILLKCNWHKKVCEVC